MQFRYFSNFMIIALRPVQLSIETSDFHRNARILFIETMILNRRGNECI